MCLWQLLRLFRAESCPPPISKKLKTIQKKIYVVRSTAALGHRLRWYDFFTTFSGVINLRPGLRICVKCCLFAPLLRRKFEILGTKQEWDPHYLAIKWSVSTASSHFLPHLAPFIRNCALPCGPIACTPVVAKVQKIGDITSSNYRIERRLVLWNCFPCMLRHCH